MQKQRWANPARKQSVWIGFDAREAAAFAVARHSLQRSLRTPIPVRGVVLSDLQDRGLYTRPTERKNGRLIDVLSQRDDYDGSISTDHAIARFLVPLLAESGWALFMDGDVLVRSDLFRLFDQCRSDKAVMVVKHDYRPKEAVKMDGQAQVQYGRKNWSSVCMWNVDHPANKALTVEMVNTLPGRDLHAFCWLDDDLIGELDQSWNWLAGHSDREINPDIVHFTSGLPNMTGYEDSDFCDEWWAELRRWAV
jgi:lipopolysaccharide biosynthesis glycosyltransferase